MVKYLVSVIKKVADSRQKVDLQQAVAQVDLQQGVAQDDLQKGVAQVDQQQAAAQRPQKKGQRGTTIQTVYFSCFSELGTIELNTHNPDNHNGSMFNLHISVNPPLIKSPFHP